MPTLITQSLVSAWQYALTCREECQEDAYADFLRTLRREPKETTPEMRNGITFEKYCYCLANGSVLPDADDKMTRGALLIADIIRGAPTQVKASRDLVVRGHILLVYGIIDALKAGIIYDVKYLNKSFGSVDLAGKYLDSVQHPAYFFIEPDAREFRYLVSDGEDLYVERYTPEQTRPFPEIAGEFLEWLDRCGLIDEYIEKWSR